jgi:hypothetical protein
MQEPTAHYWKPRITNARKSDGVAGADLLEQP